MSEWTIADQFTALAEGWGVFDSGIDGNGLPSDQHIERLDAPEQWGSTAYLASDEEAFALVQAGKQPHHIKALALHVAWLLTRRRED